MRHFSSYGPVDPRFDFAVEGRELVERCVEQLVGEPSVTMAVFVPVPDEAVPPSISGETAIEGVTVVAVAIGWV